MGDKAAFTKSDLTGFKPAHTSFVGIDSDGCVFDTMEIKQKQCFHTVTLELWGLQAVEKEAREVLEFVNLYSKWRGQNRFISQIQAFEMLRERPEVARAGVSVPRLTALKRFVDSGVPLANSTLEQAVRETGDPDLALALRWSTEVNERIARTVKNIPPYPWARESIERIHRESDAICVSQTPTEALIREWGEHDMAKYVSVIAGQELGTKAEHIGMATRGRYEAKRVLMIGDAPGDKRAAQANHALFYPIVPQREAASWERFHKEAYDRFLSGAYAGAYEAALIAEFDAELPERPPWTA